MTNQQDNDKLRGTRSLLDAGGYPMYVLVLMLIAYLFNQADRYALPITAKEQEQSIGFGDRKGGGTEYALLAGPVFQLIYTFAGIPIGMMADRYNRRNILVVAFLFWSLMTVGMGLSRTYTQLALTRAGLGLGEAGCTPLANGIISDYFPVEMRGAALGVYNWGIYMGYSIAYGLGNFITHRFGYEYVYYAFGLAGIPFALLILFTVKEPERGMKDRMTVAERQRKYTVGEVLRTFAFRPSLLLLCFAGAVRNAGGYVWAYNTEQFFEQVHDLSKDEIGTYMSWIPLVGGSLGATFGGFVADRIIKDRGSWARVWVLVFSQVLAAPFAAGALILPVPWAFISLIPSNVIGEMWVGVTLAVVVELVHPGMRVTAVAVYLFIISNIGGNAPLLVPVLRKWFDSYRQALLVLFPGVYLASAVLFFITLGVLRRDLAIARSRSVEAQSLLGPADDSGSSSGGGNDGVGAASAATDNNNNQDGGQTGGLGSVQTQKKTYYQLMDDENQGGEYDDVYV